METTKNIMNTLDNNVANPIAAGDSSGIDLANPAIVRGYRTEWSISDRDETNFTCTLISCDMSSSGTYSLFDSETGTLTIPNVINDNIGTGKDYRVLKVQHPLNSFEYDMTWHIATSSSARNIFSGNIQSKVKRLVISEGIKIIGIGAFAKMDSCQEVSLPDGLEEIQEMAFEDNKFNYINFPRSLRKIKPRGLLRNGAQEVFDISGLEDSRIEEIGIGATQKLNGTNYQTGDLELKLPRGLKVLENFAFDHCDTFKNETLHIPSTIERIGGQYNDPARSTPSHMFYNFATKTFKRFTKSERCTGVYIDANGALYSADRKTLIAVPAKMEVTNGEYTIPNECTTLGECSFSRNSTISKLNIGTGFSASETQLTTSLNGGNTLSVALYNNVTALKEIGVPANHLSHQAYNGDLYNWGYTELWYVPFGVARAVSIHPNCSKIHRGILGSDDIDASNIRLTSIFIPSGVKDIESHTLATLNKISSKVTISEDNVYWEKDSSGKIVPKIMAKDLKINFIFDQSQYKDIYGQWGYSGIYYKADGDATWSVTGNPAFTVQCYDHIEFYVHSFSPNIPYTSTYKIDGNVPMDMTNATESAPIRITETSDTTINITVTVFAG